MELVDKELEDELVDIGNKLSSPPSDVQQLLLLLDRTENFLSKVEQSPSQSMSTAIRPAMKALVAKDILCHSDADVKAAVASCLSEITRITAPEAPYDDKLMKEIFGLIVEAFKKLDKMSCRSFPKRVSILETVAKVRSCVLMLDLECDDLILEMFNHFLKTIRSNHPEKVFSSMETIMTLVIEENEIITRSLLLCLLDYLRNDQKNIMPVAKKLAEKVVVNCSSKLKPYLDDLFSGCHSINDYSKIVASLCRGKLDMLLPTQMNVGENQAVDGKLSEGAISDELPQEHHVLPEKSVTGVGKACKSVMNNGNCHLENEVSPASEEKNKLSHPDGQLKNNSGATLPTSILEQPVAAKKNDLNSRGRRGRKALLKMPVSNDHDLIGNMKVELAAGGRRKGHGKKSNFSRVDGLFEKVELSEHSKDEKKNEAEPTTTFADAAVSAPLQSPSEHDRVSPKKGRPPRAKSSDKRKAFDHGAVEDLSNVSRHKGASGRSRIFCSDIPSRDLKTKDSDAHSGSKGKVLSSAAGKSYSDITGDNKTSLPATAYKSRISRAPQGRKGSRKKVRGVEFLGQMQNDGTEKEIVLKPTDDSERESNLKELVSSPKLTVIDTTTDQSLSRRSNETKSRRKRARATHEIFGTSKRRKFLNEKLVGSTIKVWWPVDKRFYEGFVDSFDQSTKKHTILYTDGDVEVLFLKKERWEFIEGENMMAGEETIQDINSSEMKKKEKGSTDMKSPRGRKPGDSSLKRSGNSKRSGSRHPDRNTTDDNQPNNPPADVLVETTPTAVGRRKHARSESGGSGDGVDDDDGIVPKRRRRGKPNRSSMNGSSKRRKLEKSKESTSPVIERKRSRKSTDPSPPPNGESKKPKRSGGGGGGGDSSRAHKSTMGFLKGPRKVRSVKRLEKPGRSLAAQLGKKNTAAPSKKGDAEARTNAKKRKRERQAK